MHPRLMGCLKDITKAMLQNTFILSDLNHNQLLMSMRTPEYVTQYRSEESILFVRYCTN